MNFKMAPSPFPCWKPAGIFIQYLLGLLEFLEVNFPEWEPLKDGAPIWLVYTEPPAIRQVQLKVSFPELVRQRFLLRESALVSHGSLYSSVCLLNLEGCLLLCVFPSALDVRYVVDFSVCSAFYLFGQSGDFPSSLNGQLETHHSYSSVEGHFQ